MTGRVPPVCCDECEFRADSVHFLPWVDNTCERVVFACTAHDPGGYWFELSRLGRDFSLDHLSGKGWRALGLFAARLADAVEVRERVYGAVEADLYGPLRPHGFRAVPVSDFEKIDRLVAARFDELIPARP